MEMVQRKKIALVFAFALLLASASESWAQDREKYKEKEKNKENKAYKEKDYKEKSGKDRDKNNKNKADDARSFPRHSGNSLGGALGYPEERRRDEDGYNNDKHDNKTGRYDKDDADNRTNRSNPDKEKTGGILGRVILPPAGTAGPRQLQGVPKGHYPPPGSCRIWYPNRPPGQQPSHTSCGNLRGVRLEPGAFILHGDQAYDAEYDWREEERRRPGSVTRDILDILFPN